MANRSVPLAILLFLCTWTCLAQDNKFGRYIGRVVAAWNPDNRTMTLEEDFGYVDPNGVEWISPKGSKVDGASIPRFAWAIVGGPFEGHYRNASVIHDVACEAKSRPWQQVHRAFYTGMLASGVDPLKAKVMYGAVYHGGPRWNRTLDFRAPYKTANEYAVQRAASGALWDEVPRVQITPGPRQTKECHLCSHPIVLEPEYSNVQVVFVANKVPETSETDFEVLRKRIETEDMTLEQIEAFAP